MNKEVIEMLSAAIQRVLTEGGEFNYFIISLSEIHYLQVASEKSSKQFCIEAVSDNYLEEGFKLSEFQKNKLEELEWELESGDDNYNQWFDIENEEDKIMISKLLVTTAKEVYGCDEITSNMIQLELG